MRMRWLAVMLLGSACACHGNGDGNASVVKRGRAMQTTVRHVATHASDTLVSRSVGDTTPDLRDAGIFWLAFRQALIDGDTAKLTSWARFPLKVRGELDDDPIRTIEKSQFTTLIAALMNQRAGDEVHATMRDQVVATTTLDSRSFGGGDGKDFFGVGPMNFRRVGGRWKLTEVYESAE